MNIKHFKFDIVSSTIDIALNKLQNIHNTSTAVVITANKQENGRGRNKKKWFNGQNNLYYTFGMKHNVDNSIDKDAIPIYLMQIIGGLAVYKTLFSIIKKNIYLKYPNDIYIKTENSIKMDDNSPNVDNNSPNDLSLRADLSVKQTTLDNNKIVTHNKSIFNNISNARNDNLRGNMDVLKGRICFKMGRCSNKMGKKDLKNSYEYISRGNVDNNSPNEDENSFKKIAGIISEHIFSYNDVCSSIIGIGINTKQEEFPADINAISLFNLGIDIENDDLSEQLTNNIIELLNNRTNSVNYSADIVDKWAEKLNIRGKKIKIIDNMTGKYLSEEFILDKILSDGRLLVVNSGGESRIIDNGDSIRYNLE